MGRKESNQTNKQTNKFFVEYSSVINPFGQIDSSFWFDTINLEVPRDGLLYISRGIRLWFFKNIVFFLSGDIFYQQTV